MSAPWGGLLGFYGRPRRVCWCCPPLLLPLSGPSSSSASFPLSSSTAAMVARIDMDELSSSHGCSERNEEALTAPFQNRCVELPLSRFPERTTQATRGHSRPLQATPLRAEAPLSSPITSAWASTAAIRGPSVNDAPSDHSAQERCGSAASAAP